MKLIAAIILLLSTTFAGYAQDQQETKKHERKGDLYFFWGWNRGWYTNSDINFKGDDYNFTIEKVEAKDRQTKFGLNTYFNPTKATIPQYNFRVGYFITNNYNISFGIDHMKYIMVQDQAVKISGYINNTGTEFDDVYDNDNITLTKDFLQFEHTNGLNYANIEFRRFDEIYDLNKIKINITEGLGAGILLPRTNTTLLNKDRYDEFHLAGYGIDGIVAANISFFDYFFIESEFKGGFINLPDIRTTSSESDSANQHFFFYQFNVVFGAMVHL
jgi:hypothetical protein